MMGNYDKSLLHISLAVIILNIFEAYKCCKLNIYINNWYNARKICCVLSSWQECSPTSWINVNKLPEGINDVEISPVISGEKCVAMHWQMLRLSGICFFFLLLSRRNDCEKYFHYVLIVLFHELLVSLKVSSCTQVKVGMLEANELNSRQVGVRACRGTCVVYAQLYLRLVPESRIWWHLSYQHLCVRMFSCPWKSYSTWVICRELPVPYAHKHSIIIVVFAIDERTGWLDDYCLKSGFFAKNVQNGRCIAIDVSLHSSHAQTSPVHPQNKCYN